MNLPRLAPRLRRYASTYIQTNGDARRVLHCALGSWLDFSQPWQLSGQVHRVVLLYRIIIQPRGRSVVRYQNLPYSDRRVTSHSTATSASFSALLSSVPAKHFNPACLHTACTTMHHTVSSSTSSSIQGPAAGPRPAPCRWKAHSTSTSTSTHAPLSPAAASLAPTGVQLPAHTRPPLPAPHSMPLPDQNMFTVNTAPFNWHHHPSAPCALPLPTPVSSLAVGGCLESPSAPTFHSHIPKQLLQTPSPRSFAATDSPIGHPPASHPLHALAAKTRRRRRHVALCAAGSQAPAAVPWQDGSSATANGHSSPATSTSSNSALVTADEDTIAAVVTGAGSSGCVDIIRLSGPQAVEIVRSVFVPSSSKALSHRDWQPESHRIYHGKAVGQDGSVLDEVLVLTMLSPRSYTREDVVEVQCHGGGMCCQRILRALITAGARFARPGEFTLRAFLNGRLDLSQAESVTQLMTSQTPAAADSALLGLQGSIGTMAKALRAQCLELVAELEAHMDFEDDLVPLDLAGCKIKIESIQSNIEEALRTTKTGRLLRSGLQIALVGRPNVGKSSLLNALTRTNRAIVSDIAGTTRDVLDADAVLGGVPVTLVDTAGVRGTSDVVEKMGVERSAAAARAADIVLMVVDAEAGWTDADAEVFKSLWGNGPGTSSCKVTAPACLVVNKVDLSDNKEVLLPVLCREVFGRSVVSASAVTREGLDKVEEEVLKLVGAPQLSQGSVGWAVNERQAEALIRAHASLMEVVNSMQQDMPVDCWTVDLRAALRALGEVSGEDVTEEVLDSIFSRFCIGK